MVTEKFANDKIKQFTIDNGILSVTILEYGATIMNIFYKGVDCVAGYNDAEGFISGGSFQGATVGRYANRIGGGAFEIDGKKYTLDINDRGCNCLHGGSTTFAKQIMKGEQVSENAVRFTHFSKDGESGFPGNVEFAVTFTLDGKTLRLEYDAVSDRDTYLNFTNHTYFTLGAKDISKTVLTLKADYITPVNDVLIPTGELESVEGTAFDFRSGALLGERVKADHPLITAARGLDHNFVLGDKKEYRKDIAVAYSPETNITVKCSTDMPGIQIYTGNWLDEKTGKGENGLFMHCAFCLETQFFPDTPNKPQFPSALSKKDEHFTSITEYEFE